VNMFKLICGLCINPIFSDLKSFFRDLKFHIIMVFAL